VAGVGIIGSGSEARTELEALAAVRAVGAARVFSPTPERRERFAREMGERLGIDVTPAGSPQEAIDGCDLVIAATYTKDRGPALLGEWLGPGVHVNSVGSTLPSQRELDEAVWALADRVVVDARAVLTESGDAIAARAAGTLDEGRVVELHDVVTGAQAGRTDPAQTTLYKSVGTPLQDLAVAALVYEGARERGLGTERPDFQSLKPLGS
jgi:ornithine cyclodeaminase/alanine dehydrogenase